MCESVHSKPGHWMNRMVSSQRQTACSNRNVDMHMCVHVRVYVCMRARVCCAPSIFISN